MSAERRIAALFRELAEQFERLEEERSAKRIARRKIADAPPVTDPQLAARVERGMRRAGLKT